MNHLETLPSEPSPSDELLPSAWKPRLPAGVYLATLRAINLEESMTPTYRDGLVLGLNRFFGLSPKAAQLGATFLLYHSDHYRHLAHGARLRASECASTCYSCPICEGTCQQVIERIDGSTLVETCTCHDGLKTNYHAPKP